MNRNTDSSNELNIKQYKLADGTEIICEVLVNKIGETGAMQVRNCLQVQKMTHPADMNMIIFKFIPWFAHLEKDEPINLRISSVVANVHYELSDNVKSNYRDLVNMYFAPKTPETPSEISTGDSDAKAIEEAWYQKMSGKFLEH